MNRPLGGYGRDPTLITVKPSAHANINLSFEAARRGWTVERLAEKIIDMVAEDSLFRAVLDD